MNGIAKCKNKRCGVCNIIIEGKSYTFENPKTTFMIIQNLSCNTLSNVTSVKKYI